MALDARLMRAAALLDTDPCAAAREADDILKAHPGHPAAMLLLGTAHRSTGNLEGAQVLNELAAAQPDSAPLQHELGKTFLALGRDTEALAVLRRAVELEPNLAEAWRELAALHARLGDADACDVAYAHFTRLASPEKHLAEAHLALANHRLDAAGFLLRMQLRKDPEDSAALRMSAEIAAAREDYAESERLYLQCLAAAPGYSRARFDYARTLHEQQKPQPMLPLLERLLRLEPASLPYRSLQASAFALLGQNERARRILETLIGEFPGNEDLRIHHGNALRTAGFQEQAIAAYRKAIELRASCGEAYFCLSNLKTWRFTEAEIAGMRAQAQRPDLADRDRLQLDFALGKALEDEREFGAAFEHYVHGNALRRRAVLYEADANARFVRRLRELYSAEFFGARAAAGSPAADPIFIVGLPRSGSTLIEQILASHSQVEGTRELPDIQGFALELGLRESLSESAQFAQPVQQLSREELEALGERYLAQTRPARLLGRPHFIDKLPSNFFHVGLIQVILPNARIIDARRSAMACCFSNFKQHFQAGVWFSYNLDDIGRFYRGYVQLMAHYDNVLPGRVHRVRYEDLIADLPGEVRRLLDYCGLPFEDRCLRFHETQRNVQTASSEQVRRPLFAEGLDQWRNFEPWLGELKQALGDLDTQQSASPRE
ncbi:MAG TPA: sulfotransferase [Steroidobacteraceae bacterium]|nr:sulfotransferase [Steroidobacteraceae bacterium]